MSVFFWAAYLASRRQRTSTLLTGRSLLELFGHKCKDSQQLSTAIGRKQPYWLKYKIARRLKWSEGSRLKYPIWHKALKADRGDSGRAPNKNMRSGEEFPPDRHQSIQQPSLASSQVHLEEYRPPYRRVHKVREEKVQAESEYSLRSRSSGFQ